MTDFAGMPSYFWLTSSPLKEPIRDDVPYTTQALRQDLLRLRNAWEECQASRDRDTIYNYLSAVFNLVAWWAVENRDLERACKALRMQNLVPNDPIEPFAAVIRCTADPGKVDKRTRSKWSRVLRYALRYKDHAEPLDRTRILHMIEAAQTVADFVSGRAQHPSSCERGWIAGSSPAMMTDQHEREPP
jgi:hypothetical protein